MALTIAVAVLAAAVGALLGLVVALLGRQRGLVRALHDTREFARVNRFALDRRAEPRPPRTERGADGDAERDDATRGAVRVGEASRN